MLFLVFYKLLQFVIVHHQNHSFLVYNALTVINYFANIKNPVIFVPSFVTIPQLRSWHPTPEGTPISRMFDDAIKNIIWCFMYSVLYSTLYTDYIRKRKYQNNVYKCFCKGFLTK